MSRFACVDYALPKLNGLSYACRINLYKLTYHTVYM